MALPAVVVAALANPKTILLFNLLLSQAIRAIWTKITNMTPEEVDLEIIKQEERTDELAERMDEH